MSFSPPLRRLSEASTSSRESLINAYEAEEERIINILSRKLEKVSPRYPSPVARFNRRRYIAQRGEDRARERPRGRV